MLGFGFMWSFSLVFLSLGQMWLCDKIGVLRLPSASWSYNPCVFSSRQYQVVYANIAGCLSFSLCFREKTSFGGACGYPFPTWPSGTWTPREWYWLAWVVLPSTSLAVSFVSLGCVKGFCLAIPKNLKCLDFAQPSLKLMLKLGELEWFCHRNQTRLLWCERATKVNWGRNRGQEEFLWDWLTIWPFCVRNKVQTLSMYFLSFHVVLFHAQLCIRRVIWIKLNYEGFPFLVH